MVSIIWDPHHSGAHITILFITIAAIPVLIALKLGHFQMETPAPVRLNLKGIFKWTPSPLASRLRSAIFKWKPSPLSLELDGYELLLLAASNWRSNPALATGARIYILQLMHESCACN